MWRPGLAFFVFAAFVPTCLAAEPQRALAAGGWSAPVADNRGYAVRGRLVIAEKPAAGDLRETVIFVELQEATGFIGESLGLFCDLGRVDYRDEAKIGLDCELRDRDKRPVKSMPFPFGGSVPKSEWVTLPPDAAIRLRATPFGLRRAKAFALCPHLGKLWVLAENDPNEYYLSGKIDVDPPVDRTPPDKEHVWRGTIPFPAVKLVPSRLGGE
ncbi:MAG TPA: hypothetical protein VH120_00425 [Gemmataceae bacterium]|jgi:hypothetical protein|nr:hypothetical protein [Gemmataceae bacterium]